MQNAFFVCQQHFPDRRLQRYGGEPFSEIGFCRLPDGGSVSPSSLFFRFPSKIEAIEAALRFGRFSERSPAYASIMMRPLVTLGSLNFVLFPAPCGRDDVIAGAGRE